MKKTIERKTRQRRVLPERLSVYFPSPEQLDVKRRLEAVASETGMTNSLAGYYAIAYGVRIMEQQLKETKKVVAEQ